MKKKLLGDKDWIWNGFCVSADDVPNSSSIGRIQIMSPSGGIICLKTRKQAEWILESLKESIEYAWGKK